MTQRRLLFVAVLLAAAACGPPDAAQPAARSSAAAPAAAVAMPDRYGAAVAGDVLQAGGNAVDAAVAAGFALAVTYPEAGNLGGGGFMVIHIDGQQAFLDYREIAPLAAHRDMYLDDGGEVIAGASLYGHRAAGVPGTVAGMWAAHRRYGSLPWQDLLLPAVRLAEDGFVVPDALGSSMLTMAAKVAGRTNLSEYFDGLVAGETFRQPELAATLRRIAARGAGDFYRGETADLLVAEMQRGGGLITHEDLERYHAVWREPLRSRWRDYEIVSAPPPSSGGFGVIQLLGMKDRLSAQFAGQPHNSPQYIHLVAEMEKRVFADRAAYLGDPDYVATRIEELIDEHYIAQRARQVDPHNISGLAAVPPGLETRHTTHYSILDQWGNAVANTYTLNLGFGSGVVVEGAGFLLNDEMDDFSVKAGVPNAYGVVGSEANAIQPGKRMLSSMSPTLLLKGGDVTMVVGTPGGSTIFTSVFQTIVNILDFGMTPSAAVAATRFHHQLLPPDLITYSPGRPLPAATISVLEERGYRVQPHDWEFGDVQLIWRDGDRIVPASDPRGRGVSRSIDALPAAPAARGSAAEADRVGEIHRQYEKDDRDE